MRKCNRCLNANVSLHCNFKRAHGLRQLNTLLLITILILQDLIDIHVGYIYLGTMLYTYMS